MASDLETLTTFFAEQGVSEPGNSLHSWRCEYPDRYGECACVEEMITDLLSSDWLRERDRRIRSVVGKEIAEAIESRYLGPDSGRLPDGRDAPDAAQRNAYDEGLELAARIAHRASRGIGGGA